MRLKFSLNARISKELHEEIKKCADKNNMNFTDASRKIAKMVGRNRNKRIIIQDEIKF